MGADREGHEVPLEVCARDSKLEGASATGT